MKKIVSTALACVLTLSLISTSALAATPWNRRVTMEWSNWSLGLNNFQEVRTYYPGVFTDVSEDAWYAENLRTLYCMGLADGGVFNPNGYMTLGDVVDLAATIHSTYHNWVIPADQTELEYALAVGIVAPMQYDNYNDLATRRSFAAIMAKALPAEALTGINTVLDNIIPDVPAGDPGAQAIYQLYRAGVMLGADSKGTFYPNDLITRVTAAVAASRMVSPALRQGISLFSADAGGILLNRATMTLSVGEVGVLVATVVPENAQNKNVTWSSSRPWIASVDGAGRVTGIAEGTAVITASTVNGVTATCAVGVDVAPLTFSGTGYYKDWLTVPDFGTLSRVVPARIERTDSHTSYYYPMDKVTDEALVAYGDRLIAAGFLLERTYDNERGQQQLVFYKIADAARRQMVTYGQDGDYLVVSPGRAVTWGL